MDTTLNLASLAKHFSDEDSARELLEQWRTRDTDSRGEPLHVRDTPCIIEARDHILKAIQRLEQRISPALPEHESRDDDADN